MKLTHIAVLILISISAVPVTQAQQPIEQIPQGLESLRQTASSKTEFTLDHSMLVFASKLESDNEDFRRVIAGVSGLSVHNFHFPGPWMYDPGALGSVRQEYQAEGWKQLINRHDRNGDPGMSGLWVRFEHNAISNISILLARQNEVTFIEIAGSISPLDLSHLGGHFGIPRIEGGLEVPNARASSRPVDPRPIDPGPVDGRPIDPRPVDPGPVQNR
jgi:hypothetical protein